jgi:ABC-type uncharacterized transport system permease subunit
MGAVVGWLVVYRQELWVGVAVGAAVGGVVGLMAGAAEAWMARRRDG